MAAIKWSKDPEDVIDYSLNWVGTSQAMGLAYGKTIQVSSWTVPVGLVKVNDSHDGAATTIRISGGTKGRVYDLINHVTLTDGQEFDQSVKITVKDR